MTSLIESKKLQEIEDQSKEIDNAFNHAMKVVEELIMNESTVGILKELLNCYVNEEFILGSLEQINGKSMKDNLTAINQISDDRLDRIATMVEDFINQTLAKEIETK